MKSGEPISTELVAIGVSKLIKRMFRVVTLVIVPPVVNPVSICFSQTHREIFVALILVGLRSSS